MTIREAIAAGDLDAVSTALAPDVVWVGALPGQLCRNREQVLGMLRRASENGRTWRPEILREREGTLLVDPHVEPPPELNPNLHQVVVVEDELVVELRDYPDRETALAAFERLAELWGDA